MDMVCVCVRQVNVIYRVQMCPDPAMFRSFYCRWLRINVQPSQTTVECLTDNPKNVSRSCRSF